MEDTAQIADKLDKLIDAVHQQNIILAEHTDRLEKVGRELAMMQDVQRAHGTEVERLAIAVRQLKRGNLDGSSGPFTPVPRLDPSLTGSGGGD